MRYLFVAALSLTALAVAGCSDADANLTPREQAVADARAEMAALRDPALISRGRDLFTQNCATCHGPAAEATPQWRVPDERGYYPPPPLNGSAHAWHHPLAQLRSVIRNGSPDGSGRMPAWGGRLSDRDIDAVIAWFQSMWSPEVHEAWADMNLRAARQRASN